jgi:LmbE family N-acetylglucosaminyl deacetylase
VDLELDSDDRVVVLVAHPDDEAFAHGGLLARAAARGAAAQVVCLTAGEGGRPRQPRRPGVDEERVAELRAAELGAACASVGAAEPCMLGARDGSVDASDEALLEQVVGALRALAPTLLCTCGRDGVYGHRDHLASLQLAQAACATLGEAAPRHLGALFPRGLFAPLWRRLRRLPLIDSTLGAGDLGVDPSAAVIALALDDRERQAKRAMLACHASQLVDGDPSTFLLPEIAAWVLEHEWYGELDQRQRARGGS